eukprot:SAG22_NODE_3223_length_1846_cov_31.499141_2_plen_127_part_00
MNADNAGHDFVDQLDSWLELNEAAKTRDYSGDAAATDPTEFLLSLDVAELPHPSRGLGNYSATANFLVHLEGTEAKVRAWQAADGKEAYPDSVCLGALCESRRPHLQQNFCLAGHARRAAARPARA